ncbi:UDP-Glycosyltransferase superfamily protein [Prunus dulcis]|uniref:UDP-Glycosyltransferase superfamily protein n=1 Tax=Prunus dulcis TaxID=3755 RepID=A0A4Y1QW79_PRUDU|nr:UDP-Glycosyltransferase superfamily protein [Prunus dulcis]
MFKWRIAMEVESQRTKPVAVFMAFGTKGDVYPIAAIAVAFACDQRQYDVVLITHSAHENLRCHLAEQHVSYRPISSPPVLSIHQKHDPTGSVELPFSLQKRMFSSEHRQECYLVVESIFGSGPSMEGDFIVINFFALEGWSFAELFRVRCMVAAPYVVPYSAPSSFERHFKQELPLLYKYLKEADISKNSLDDNDIVIITRNGYWPSKVRVVAFGFSPMNGSFHHGIFKKPSSFSSTSPNVMEITGYRFILFTAGYMPLDTAIRAIVAESSSYVMHKQFNDECLSLFNDRLFCFSGTIPYKWLFTRCVAAIHHGGSYFNVISVMDDVIL